MAGAPGATGSVRHDQGRAADFDLIDPKTNKVIGRNDPRRLSFIESASRAGAGGAGFGYMTHDTAKLKMHMGLTGSRGIVGQGLGAYAGTKEERAAVSRGIAQSKNFNLQAWMKGQQQAGGGGGGAGGGGAIGGGGGGGPGPSGNLNFRQTRLQQANDQWMKNPANQQKVYRLLQAEGHGNIGANLEQLSNYAAARGRTIGQVIEARGGKDPRKSPQYYGPLRRLHGDPGAGPLKPHERGAFHSPWTSGKQAEWDKARKEVFEQGSNRINYRTMQGMAGDPNANLLDYKYGVNRFGVQPGTQKWVAAQRAQKNAPPPPPPKKEEPAPKPAAPAPKPAEPEKKEAEARQHGGPVAAGKPYLVGEKGPEMMVPKQSGNILPNLGAAAKDAGKAALRQVIPGMGLVGMMKKDSEQGHPMRTKLRGALGIEDPKEPAPWQQAKAERDELSKPIPIRYEHQPGEMQFRRKSIRASVDREVREAKYTTYGDTGAA